tara:strand:+ start:1721 stop:2437 length:717 start_codon:yes stop_codon:yes gene_type:complete
MKAILFSMVVLGMGCAQVSKKAEPNPLTVLLKKQAEWQATENGLRNQLQEAVRAAEEAERRALDVSNDAKDVELHLERLEAEANKLRNHTQAEAAARRQVEAKFRELEQHAARMEEESKQLRANANAEGSARQQAMARLKELEQHTARQQAEANKLCEQAKAEAAARQKAISRSHQLERKIALLQRQLGEAHRMTEAFAAQTKLLLELYSAPAPCKPAAKTGNCRGQNCRHRQRAPRR